MTDRLFMTRNKAVVLLGAYTLSSWIWNFRFTGGDYHKLSFSKIEQKARRYVEKKVGEERYLEADRM
jgi:hypothetical protein